MPKTGCVAIISEISEPVGILVPVIAGLVRGIVIVPRTVPVIVPSVYLVVDDLLRRIFK